MNEDEENLIVKSGNVEVEEISDDDLKKINKYTLVPVTKEEVFTFKVNACDNELDDRNFEPFNLNALKDLKNLYLGKTVIKDHSRKAENQIGRVYDTNLIQNGKMTGANEPFTTLQLKCYMIKTENNKDLIAEIKGGIKKEVSTGTVPKHSYCSICGTDNTKSYCSHWWGKEYDTKQGKKTCYFTLDGAKEAYELSFVAVPAQRRAGTTKATEAKEKLNSKNIENKQSIVSNKLKEMDCFLFMKKMEELENE